MPSESSPQTSLTLLGRIEAAGDAEAWGLFTRLYDRLYTVGAAANNCSLADYEDGFLKDASHLIVDRDTSFIAMREILEENTGTEIVQLPPKSPNLNADMEHWFRSLKI